MDLIHRRLHLRHTGPQDPYYSYTSLLLFNENSADGVTTLIDQSQYGHTVINSNLVFDNAQYPTGMATAILTPSLATGCYASIPDHAGFDFGSGSFTIEGWIRYSTRTGTAYTGYPVLYKNYESSTKQFVVELPGVGDPAIYINYNNTYKSIAWNPTANIWYHVALVKTGTSCIIYINGAKIGSTLTVDATITNPSAIVTVGTALNAGWLGPIRVSKGLQRYTSNFTSPTLPLPNW